MDIGLLTSISRLDQSPVPGVFCRRQLFKDNPDRKTVNWAPFKAEWSPWKELAHKRSWQRKFKENREKGDLEVNRFLEKSLQNSNWYKSLPKPKQDTSQSTDIWSTFRAYVEGYSTQTPEHEARKVIQFLLTQGCKSMNGVDTAVWMLIAHQELTLVESGYEIGSGNEPESEGLAIDIEKWTPVEEGNKLISTKRRVLNSIYDLYNNSNPSEINFEEKKRIFRELMKPNFLVPNVKLSLLTDKRFDGYIPKHITDSIIGANKLDAENEFKAHLNLLVNYAEFFEYMQAALLNNGLTHKEIISLFSACKNIKTNFYRDLDVYLKCECRG